NQNCCTRVRWWRRLDPIGQAFCVSSAVLSELDCEKDGSGSIRQGSDRLKVFGQSRTGGISRLRQRERTDRPTASRRVQQWGSQSSCSHPATPHTRSEFG